MPDEERRLPQSLMENGEYALLAFCWLLFRRSEVRMLLMVLYVRMICERATWTESYQGEVWMD